MFKPIDLINALNFERLAGTDGEKAGIEVITEFVKNTGFDSETEAFEIATFNSGTGQITAGATTVPATPFGLVTDTDITAEMVYVENANRLAVDEGRYRDKIVLCYGQCRDLNKVLKDGGIKAFIRITPPHKKAFQLGHHQSTFDEGPIPVVTIIHDDGLKLAKLSGSTITLTVKQETFKANAHNIVVDVKGTDSDNNLTYLVAHFDTVANTPGSSDNAAGCACLIKILEHFGKNPPKRDLKVVFCSGEELGLLGSSAYVAAHEEEVTKRGKLVMNIDVSGDALGTDAFNILGTKELMGYADGIVRENGLFFQKVLDIYSSDCMPFAQHEIPAINIARWGGEPSCYCHTADDTPEKICNEALERSAKAGRVILDRILNAQIYPVTKAIDESLREKVEKYMYWNTRQEPKLNWEPKYKK